jgi:drug/metabolite transporter (DMT)-like permease
MTTEPQPISTGLWGRTGLLSQPSKRTILLLLSLSFLGYAFSLLINGASGRVLRPRFVLPPLPPSADPLTPLGLVVLVFDPMFLLASFRFLACLLLGTVLIFSNGPHGPPIELPVRVQLLIPVLVGLTNAGGYAFYLSLTARGGVAVWSALVGVYIVFPVTYSILVYGEARTPRKMWGIATCILASILLGLGEEEKEAGAGRDIPWYSNAFLYLTCILCWGVCDGLSAFMGRDLHLGVIAILTGCGFGLFALLMALLSFFLSSGLGGGLRGEGDAPVEGGGGVSFAGGYALMAAAQASGVMAWFLSVRLGMLSEASAFLPIISLYTMGASILAVPILGENHLPPIYWVGLCFGCGGILLIAYSGEGNGEGGSSSSNPPMILVGEGTDFPSTPTNTGGGSDTFTPTPEK